MSSSTGLLLSALLFQAAWCVGAQTGTGAQCARTFKMGKENFVLDTEDAVKEGAMFISSPTVSKAEDCVASCCQDPQCNLALIEKGTEEESVKTCFLFNCVYKRKYVCRFVNKAGFINYILDSVYENHLAGPASLSGEKDPPIANAGRNIVVQPGDQVTLNGIESQALGDSQITDYHWSLVQGNSSAVMEKTKLADQLLVSKLWPGVYIFQLRVTDSNDQSDTANVTVLVLSPEQSDLHCLVPMKVGPCRGAFPRWHYNAASGGCETFTFGGCKGNHNNYLSKKECSAACDTVTAASERSIGTTKGEVCGTPCRPGQFVCGNGCCLDKGQECDNVPQCSDGSDEAACTKLNQTFTRLLNIDVNQKKARCAEPPRTGPCRASHTRWYYDPLNRKCHRFTFGGCDANDNNFELEEMCSKTCEGITEKNVFARGMFERYEEEEESESGSIAIAVVLAVAIFAVLAVLSYCFLKSRRKRSHQPVTTNVPHTPFTEDRDTLVYNSTTKPV
ncbi:kunitz-type protease inhibitor 1-like [Polymixia lowei]